MIAIKQRNYFLDAARGIAMLSIIYIHTVFFSGKSYVPDILRHMSLIIDVPLFFFLAGWGFAYSKSFMKTVKNDLRIHLQYSYYILVVALIMLIFGSSELSWDHVGHWLVYSKTNIDVLTSTVTSSWFLKVFMPVTIVGGLMITKLKRNAIYTALAIIPFLWLHAFYNPTAFLGDQTFWFYLLLYMLGYLSKDIKIKKFGVFLLLGIAVLAILGIIKYVFLLPIFNLQDHKFPPNVVYLLWSSLSILAVLYFKQFNWFKAKSALVKLGQNAIWLFLAQGISSSILYYLVDTFNMHWLPKLAILFAINVVLAIIIAIALKLSFRGISWVLKRLYLRIKPKVQEDTPPPAELESTGS